MNSKSQPTRRKTCATSASAASHLCSTRLPAQKIFGLSISSQRERMAPCNLVGRGRLQILRIFAHTGAFKTIASVSIKRVNACDIAAVIGSRYGGNIPSSSGVRGQLRHALTANLGTLRNLKTKIKQSKLQTFAIRISTSCLFFCVLGDGHDVRRVSCALLIA